MSEKQFEYCFHKAVKSLHCKTEHHEDLYNKGRADRWLAIPNGKTCRIEMKKIRDYPQRENTAIRIPHFTKDQQNCLKTWYECNKSAYLFLKINSDYYLFRGDVAAFLWKNPKEFKPTKEKLETYALVWYKKKMDWPDFIKTINEDV